MCCDIKVYATLYVVILKSVSHFVCCDIKVCVILYSKRYLNFYINIERREVDENSNRMYMTV